MRIVFALIFLLQFENGQSQDQPNIILIIGDQMVPTLTSKYGHPKASKADARYSQLWEKTE